MYKPFQALPDTSVCRARRSGIGDYVYCLVESPVSCSKVLNFGERYFCLHPENQAIAAHTQAGQSEGGK